MRKYSTRTIKSEKTLSVNTNGKVVTRGAAAAVVALFASLMLLGGCATAARRDTYGLDAAGTKLVSDTCREVMGLRPGESHFDGCARSLADSLQTAARANAIASAHRECLHAGLQQGSPQFAQCVLDRGYSEARRANPLLPVAEIPGGRTASSSAESVHYISYFSMNPTVRFEREQKSCARLGIDPISSEFTSCVSGLRWAFFDLDNPSS